MASLAVDAATPPVKTFGLGDVELLDSPFKQAMERNAEYLLSLDADRLLHNTRKYAGLKPKGELYGGWESQGIAGHTLRSLSDGSVAAVRVDSRSAFQEAPRLHHQRDG